jgi:hypothetical protein
MACSLERHAAAYDDAKKAKRQVDDRSSMQARCELGKVERLFPSSLGSKEPDPLQTRREANADV